LSGRAAGGILLLVLSLAVTVSGLLAVYQTEYACGWDGYYYLVQVQSLNNTGVMHSPEYSLVYAPLIALHSITGNYEASYKISAVLFKLLFVLSEFSLASSLLRYSGSGGREAFLTALIAAAVSAMSPSMNYFFTQFPKNLLGFALLFFFMACVFGTSRRWRERKTVSSVSLGIAGAVLLFLAAFFTHRFSAVLLLCFLVLFFAPVAGDVLKRLWTGDSRKRGRWTVICAAVFILLVLIVSSRLPLAPSVHDLERITGDLSLKPVFVPAAFVSTFDVSRLTPAWHIEIYIASLLPILSGLLFLFRKRFSFLHCRGYYILIILSLIGLFPFAGFSLMGLSYRLFFGTLLMFPVILIPYIRWAVDRVLRLKGTLKSRGVPVVVFSVLLGFSFVTARSYRPEIHDPPYEFYESIAADAVTALSDLDYELIIAHKALAEMITFRYEIDALPWSPEEYFHRGRVWRITAGILEDEFSYYLSPAVVDSYFVRLSSDYGLLREDKWEDFLESIVNEPVMLNAVDTWRNPLERRPTYLVGNR
jgi:hypothetical protein